MGGGLCRRLRPLLRDGHHRLFRRLPCPRAGRGVAARRLPRSDRRQDHGRGGCSDAVRDQAYRGIERDRCAHHTAPRDRCQRPARVPRRHPGLGAGVAAGEVEDDVPARLARRADPRRRAAAVRLRQAGRADDSVGGGGADADHRLGLSARRPEAHGLSAMLRVLYFASVREAIGVDEESVDVPPEAATVAALVDWLATASAAHHAAFADRARLRAAIDGRFVPLDALLGEPREVALFPPVTGG